MTLIPLLLGWGIATGLRYFADKTQAHWVANTLSRGSDKPTISVGAGCGQRGAFPSWGDLKCDIEPSGDCFYCDVMDLSEVPDKIYSVALASHVLEHVENPEYALKEIQRIADNVVVLPSWSSPTAYLARSHRHVILGTQSVVNHPYVAWALVGIVGLCIVGARQK